MGVGRTYKVRGVRGGLVAKPDPQFEYLPNFFWNVYDRAGTELGNVEQTRGRFHAASKSPSFSSWHDKMPDAMRWLAQTSESRMSESREYFKRIVRG